jgi:hypothetical protein
MFIARAEKWYRPYYVKASGRTYKLEKIHFYEDDKILVSTNSGWLEKENGADIESLELPIDEIKVKRKEKFDGEVFIISQGKERYSDELLGELYIPTEMFDVHLVKHIIKYDTQVRAIYKGTNDIYIDTYVKSIDGELKEISKQYEEIYKDCNGYNLSYYTEDVIARLDKMKALAEQYIEEKKRIKELTVEDVL